MANGLILVLNLSFSTADASIFHEVFGLKLGEQFDASQFALLEHVGFNFITELLL